MTIIHNKMKGKLKAEDYISYDPAPVLKLLEQCPKHQITALHDHLELASRFGVSRLFIKDESTRMGLGSFKALGAAYVLAHQAMAAIDAGCDMGKALSEKVFLAASAGNHGLSLAAAAKIFGAKARIYLSNSVPEAFAERLRKIGAEVIRHGNVYEESMDRALADTEAGEGLLISDTSWPGYHEIPKLIMEGYLVMGREATNVLDEKEVRPSHVFLQAGVGGLAAAMARWCRQHYGDDITIISVEPSEARPIQASISAGEMTIAPGGISMMGRLDCKEASELAFYALSSDIDFAMTVEENEAEETTNLLSSYGLHSTPSGTAGITALQHLNHEERQMLGINESSQILAFMSEGVE